MHDGRSLVMQSAMQRLLFMQEAHQPTERRKIDLQMPSHVSCKVTVFLLKGKVQGVKMRRYVESAARHFGVGGYVINIDDENDTDSGAVFGEAWVCDDHLIPQLKGFATWIRGEWVPAVYTNIKPTPVGTAYPEKATVEQYAVQTYHENVAMDHFDRFSQFTMVRSDQEAAMLSWDRREIRKKLSDAALIQGGINGEIKTGSWPRPQGS